MYTGTVNLHRGFVIQLRILLHEMVDNFIEDARIFCKKKSRFGCVATAKLSKYVRWVNY